MTNVLELPQEKYSIVQQLLINDQIKNLFIKRDDLLHPVISGNKWRKLKYNIEIVEKNNYHGILSFGGAFSNHLLALAYLCKLKNIKSVGIVRGEELNVHSNSILTYCASLGMKLKFVSREDYSLKDESEYKQELHSEFSNLLIVPEGGANYQGVIGCMEIMKDTSNDYDIVCVSQGTTTTSLGILLSIPENTTLLVCPALKGFDSRLEMTTRLSKMGFESQYIDEKMNQVRILSSDEFGKYANTNERLKVFASNFYSQTNITLDLTYNARSVYKMLEFLMNENKIDSKILYIHTGGFS
jgi:1-aminocyclopropane-1-carboxylate deaminase